jgi:hypothetical protein
MGPTRITAAAWAMILYCGVLAVAPQAMAQSFAGMSMIDFEAARDSFFKTADVDGDYVLSSEEQLDAMGAGSSDLFECTDSDGDGQCSYSEFLDSGQTLFDTLDLNHDGRLSASEVQSVQ